MQAFDNPNAFAPVALDRAGHHRGDAAWQARALEATETRIIPFHKLRPFMAEGAVGWLNAPARAHIAPSDAQTLFLGLDAEGAAHFALNAPDDRPLAELGRFEELRALAGRIADADLSSLGVARAIFEWHARNGYCANCGAPSRIVEAGWKRQCDGCGAEHFPRVDPVAIMLPVLGERCLLGRGRGFPPGMYSALAGFIEPGESIEAGVARETLEEAGLSAVSVRLHSNQPWPFPHSLMIGAICEVAADTLKVDPNELETARWFTRAEARMLIRGEYPDHFCPPPFAIAHQIIKTWAGEG